MKSEKMHSIIRKISTLFFGMSLSILLGCVPPEPEPKPSEPDPQIAHTVRYSGESLGLISSWYTGTVNNWREIQQANPGLEPTRINIGQIIYIPQHLVTEERVLPESFVRAQSKQMKKLEESVPQQVEEVRNNVEKVEETPAEVTAQVIKTEKSESVSSPEASSDEDSGFEENKDIDPEREKLLNELLSE